MSRVGLALASVFVVLMGAFPAAANAAFAIGPYARGGPGGHGHGGGGGGSAICGSSTSITNCGFDVSYPQCGASLPGPTAFAIVGVNGGLANDLNPCLGPSASYPSYTQSELYWASASTGATPVSLYVNTADPGNMYNGKPIADWPSSGTAPKPYGSCTTTTVTSTRGKRTYTVGANSDACAWVYGYDRAAQDAAWLTSAADAINAQTPAGPPDTPGSYPWWLDVETANSWQSDTSMNIADLQGMIQGFQDAGVTSIGAYSTSFQWNSITGGTSTSAGGSLYGIPTWIPGATSYTDAKANCSLSSFTGGTVTLTQWTGTIDSDYACS